MLTNRKRTDLLVNVGTFRNVTFYTTDPRIPILRNPNRATSREDNDFGDSAGDGKTTRGGDWRGVRSRTFLFSR